MFGKHFKIIHEYTSDNLNKFFLTTDIMTKQQIPEYTLFPISIPLQYNLVELQKSEVDIKILKGQTIAKEERVSLMRLFDS